ncbi:NtaA/DmoA family FMN-dependent monooxygenase [Pseudonocardia xishanensis]|uniref:NtaA/DmoA family FMN-dependent monooxygenase n=1 Tax=Pseudonocardia xishanensis TaxID=630995 RepID=A0ABP8S257_9PSEU
MFHLGWFLGSGFGIQPGRGTFDGRAWRDWMRPRRYVEMATALESGGYDFVFIEDTAMIEDTFGGSAAWTLAHGEMAPKNDPLPLVPLMAAGSKHIGIINTMSTIQYAPYTAARLMTTLDHLTDGRAGVNVVTSVTHRVAQNFGYDEHLPHDERYAMAGEWMDVVTRLWDSWEPGAVVADTETPLYADHTKVHTIDHSGKYYKVRGPLNTIPGPQGRPVVGQAGNSVPGRELAARYADTMLAMGHSVEQMKAFREDMHQRLIAHGRKPGDLKVMFLVTPMLGESDAHARDREAQRRAAVHDRHHIEQILWQLSYISGGTVDFSTFELDATMPDILGNGEQSSMRQYVVGNEDKTLREVVTGVRQIGDLGLIGSPDTVAAEMGELMDEVGGDGFLLYQPRALNPRTLAEYADGLSPALRRRGLIRDGFDNVPFRDNLLAF